MTDPLYTHIAVIADRSGSMTTISADMNGGLHTFLEEQAKLPGTLAVDVTVFDTTVSPLYSDAAVSDIKFPVIVPRGMTALLDAIGMTVVQLGEKFSKLPEERRPSKVLIIIVTDGQENSSREWTTEKVKDLVTQQQNDYDWNFVFLGANIDSFAVGGGLGINAQGIMDFSASTAGVQGMTRSMSAYASTYRGGQDASFSDEDREDAAKI